MKSRMRILPLVLVPALIAAADAPPDGRQSALGAKPDGTILRLASNGDGKPDVLERWWNGKRVRWLDENGDMCPDDLRGDRCGDTMQIDMDGDGRYDGQADVNIRWLDTNGDGIPDVQIIAENYKLKKGQKLPSWPDEGHWMLFINPDASGVLGWFDWEKSFDFDCWAYTNPNGNWLPNYRTGDFLKIHHSPGLLNDARLNWENPFSFFDLDGDGLAEMAMRWVAPFTKDATGTATISDHYNEVFLTMDVAKSTGRHNEGHYDLSLRAGGGTSSFAYTQWTHAIPGLDANPVFDRFFAPSSAVWRHIKDVRYIPRDRQWDGFFDPGFKEMWMTFDEDGDDHRWERVELLYPENPKTHKRNDPWTTRAMKRTDGVSGLDSHMQADSRGDRGEFDRDNSGKGRLYVGAFDRKFHLFGAEWGAWTVDRAGEFHGGWRAGGWRDPKPSATNVGEVVIYSDTDANGFIDRIEFDYDGDHTIDLTINLLDYATAANPHPDVAEVLDTRALGWQGLHTAFVRMTEQSWEEAQRFYQAAWQRDLCDRETDLLAVAASVRERYEHAYWLKETLLRRCRVRLADARTAEPMRAAEFTAVEKNLLATAYLGRWNEVANVLPRIPAQPFVSTTAKETK
jgi:hypothetical protein